MCKPGIDPQVLAKDLDVLQSGQNDGRGVMCVQSVCHHLRCNDLPSAKAIAEWDSDKIAQYPAIVEALKQSGLVEDRYNCGYGYCLCAKGTRGLICNDRRWHVWHEAGRPTVYSF